MSVIREWLRTATSKQKALVFVVAILLGWWLWATLTWRLIPLAALIVAAVVFIRKGIANSWFRSALPVPEKATTPTTDGGNGNGRSEGSFTEGNIDDLGEFQPIDIYSFSGEKLEEILDPILKDKKGKMKIPAPAIPRFDRNSLPSGSVEKYRANGFQILYGWIAGAILIPVLALIISGPGKMAISVIFVLFVSWIIKQWSYRPLPAQIRGLVLRAGKPHKLLRDGPNFIIPGLESVCEIFASVKAVDVEIAAHEVTTAGFIGMLANVHLKLQVVDKPRFILARILGAEPTPVDWERVKASVKSALFDFATLVEGYELPHQQALLQVYLSLYFRQLQFRERYGYQLIMVEFEGIEATPADRQALKAEAIAEREGKGKIKMAEAQAIAAINEALRTERLRRGEAKGQKAFIDKTREALGDDKDLAAAVVVEDGRNRVLAETAAAGNVVYTSRGGMGTDLPDDVERMLELKTLGRALDGKVGSGSQSGGAEGTSEPGSEKPTSSSGKGRRKSGKPEKGRKGRDDSTTAASA